MSFNAVYAMRNFPAGTRVKGAWGLGTVISASPWGEGGGATKRAYYCAVQWDKGMVSPRQRCDTLTILAPAVPTTFCPNCEIDEMIFYGEDYICAWCREMLER